MKKFPTLYKKNAQGVIEQWTIQVVKHGIQSFEVAVHFGEYDGKQQTKSYHVRGGKNIGRSNETTASTQAVLEAEAKWKKKLKAGYVDKYKDAVAGKLDDIISGGIIPMLAHKFDDYLDKIKYPVFIQPKLDGERCIAMKINGKVTLWTRTRKPITSCPHIIEQVEQILSPYSCDLFLDGELYVHGVDNFEKIMSAVRKQSPTEESKLIQYHVYDCEIMDDLASPFQLRKEFLENLADYFSHVKFVEADMCHNYKVVQENHDYYVNKGYEGIMVRNPNGVYENKRSKNLLKLKNFLDDEFDIVDVKAGKDSTVIFVCRIGKEYFEATMSGNKKDNQKYLYDSKLWEGKKLTVKYQCLTGANKVPRFPVGVRIREDI